MMSISNNPPEITLNLTREQAEFIIRNCDSNIRIAVNIAMSDDYSEPAQVQASSLGRQFQELKELVTKALKD